MQNIFIMRDPLAPDDPCAWVASPGNASVWRNDQDLNWKILDPTGTVTWANPPFVFDAVWFEAGGTEPVPVENPSGGPPFYQATGPGANMNTVPSKFHYTINIDVPACGGPIRVGMKTDELVVDPDVWNQPQP